MNLVLLLITATAKLVPQHGPAVAVTDGLKGEGQHRLHIARCLANRSVWILGNSVARHWAFTLHDMLMTNLAQGQRMPPDGRRSQQVLCGRGGAFQGSRLDGGHSVTHSGQGKRSCYGTCACRFDDVWKQLGTELSFGWVYEVTSAIVEQELLNSLLSNSSAADPLVVYNVGLPHAECRYCKGVTGLEEAQAGAPRLAAMVARLQRARPGLRFYYRATTPLCYSKGQREAEIGQINASNAEIRQINVALSEALRGVIPQRQILDAYAWADTAGCQAYDDRIHHSLLALDHLQRWLSVVCK